MASFEIYGGKPLHGTLTPQGAKNEALQVICATLLTDEPVRISNIPDIRDINRLIELLQGIGTHVERTADTCTFQTGEVDFSYMESDEFLKKAGSLRGSIMMLGPLLARFRKGVVARPGGDKIGRRKLDVHFDGMMRLGAQFS
ncbi:MAG: UDP-N-acetylglucosamine 1-carboxyvinyltransferase, partial [Bacteroidales bacterium]|nr:UDP-N-acetylglucosamine 1-carboxyvinyltransferase [Bacteroidales bacterium]